MHVSPSQPASVVKAVAMVARLAVSFALEPVAFHECIYFRTEVLALWNHVRTHVKTLGNQS